MKRGARVLPLLCAALLAALEGAPRSAPQETSAEKEPRPGDIAGDVVEDLSQRPLDAILSEERLTLAEVHDLERRSNILAESQERSRAHLRKRLHALYKLSQGGFGRLLLQSDGLLDMYVRRNGARLIISRDLDELYALRSELRELDSEQAELMDRIARLSQLGTEAARARARLAAGLHRPLQGLGRERGMLPRPVQPGAIVGVFGPQFLEHGLEWFQHGVELSAEPGQKVRAVAAGQVRYTGEVAGQGRGVIVEHEGGYLSLYARLDQIAVVPGDPIAAGTALGRAPFSRVLFQLFLGDLPLDPEPWFRNEPGAGKRRPTSPPR